MGHWSPDCQHSERARAREGRERERSGSGALTAMLAAASATLLLATASSGAGSGPSHPGTGPNPRNCSCSCELTSGCGGPLSTVAPNVMLMSDSIGANGAPHLRLRSPRTPQTPLTSAPAFRVRVLHECQGPPGGEQRLRDGRRQHPSRGGPPHRRRFRRPGARKERLRRELREQIQMQPQGPPPLRNCLRSAPLAVGRASRPASTRGLARPSST